MVRLHPYILEIIAQFWKLYKADVANFYPIFHFVNKKILVRPSERHDKSANEPARFIGLFFAPVWARLLFRRGVWSFIPACLPILIYYIRKNMLCRGGCPVCAGRTKCKTM